MALSKDRDTKRRDGTQFTAPVAASTKIYAGGMVAINTSSLAVPAAATATLKVVGVAEEAADNSAGSASDISVKYRKGIFKFKNSASTDLIALTDVNASCYAVDDETVAKTSNSNARPVAGVIRDVDADGSVWVEF